MIDLIETGETTLKKLSDIKSDLDKKDFYSRMNFLNDHNGLRRGELSTLTASYGSGKSTLIRTLLAELAMAHRKVYCFLSEEAADKYNQPLSESMTSMADINYANKSLCNIFYLSQIKMPKEKKNLDCFIAHLEDMANFHGVEVFVIDNFTTSFLGDATISEQARASEMLKAFAVRHNVVMLVVIHTKKHTDIYANLITGDDVRGNATIINMSSYSYILTTFFGMDKPRAFIFVDKARYHQKSNKRVYELCYDETIKIFTADALSSQLNMRGIMNRARKEMQNV